MDHRAKKLLCDVVTSGRSILEVTGLSCFDQLTKIIVIRQHESASDHQPNSARRLLPDEYRMRRRFDHWSLASAECGVELARERDRLRRRRSSRCHSMTVALHHWSAANDSSRALVPRTRHQCQSLRALY
jgi:hypothetical protein